MAAWRALIFTSLLGTPALASAQDGSPTLGPVAQGVRPPAADLLRPIGSVTPSDATGTVSPVTAAQAMERLDPAPRDFSVSLGSSLATGDFGGDRDTRITSVALGARYVIGDVRLSASIPWMSIRSNGTFFTGIDSTPVVVSPGVGRRTTHKGLGDLTLGAAYTLSQGKTEIELSGRTKLSTATRSSALSSGKTDYAIGLQIAQTSGRFVPFVSATYRMFGDPRGLNLNNGVAASAGASMAMDGNKLLLVSYHFAESASRFVRDAHEMFAGFSVLPRKAAFRITAFTTVGLSSGASALSGGIALSTRF